jgi:hypothetical protein
VPTILAPLGFCALPSPADVVLDSPLPPEREQNSNGSLADGSARAGAFQDRHVMKGWSEIAGSFKDDDKLLHFSPSVEGDEKIDTMARAKQFMFLPVQDFLDINPWHDASRPPCNPHCFLSTTLITPSATKLCRSPSVSAAKVFSLFYATFDITLPVRFSTSRSLISAWQHTQVY